MQAGCEGFSHPSLYLSIGSLSEVCLPPKEGLEPYFCKGVLLLVMPSSSLSLQILQVDIKFPAGVIPAAWSRCLPGHAHSSAEFSTSFLETPDTLRNFALQGE